MKTEFSLEQLREGALQEANDILRRCVHCGFCNATCPTFRLTGDERDGPRGRIYLIKELLETDGANREVATTHIDRCLTCLSCTTTCPSGVEYGRLLDAARPMLEDARKAGSGKWKRWFFGQALTRNIVFQSLVTVGRWLRPAAEFAPKIFADLVSQIPRRKAARSEYDRPQVFKAKGGIRYRVAIHPGCVQRAVDPEITRAAIRLLTRHGCEVVLPKKLPCCGALNHHLGQEERAKTLALANVKQIASEMRKGRLEAVISTASGCGTTLKDYAFLLKDESEWRDEAADIAEKVMDISEFALRLELDVVDDVPPIRVAYQSPCSLQHGQKNLTANQKLLTRCGFNVVEPTDQHICCGSAGVYSFLEPKFSKALRKEKAENLDELEASAVASANIGCMSHLKPGLKTPIFHTVQLLDWATGGPKPKT